MGNSDKTDLEDLLDEFEILEETVDTNEERKKVRDVMHTAIQATKTERMFGRVIKGFDRGDIAEALLGSIIFGVPMVVEGGTQEVAEFLAIHPIYLAGNVLFSIGTVLGILYIADIQEVKIHKPIFGLIPRRLIGVILTSFTTALILMTMWGRINWTNTYLALSNIIVVFLPMSIGAALGDILPGD